MNEPYGDVAGEISVTSTEEPFIDTPRELRAVQDGDNSTVD
jgi:hypothetical protein